MKAFFVTLTLVSLIAAPVFAGSPYSIRAERSVVIEHSAPRLSVEPVRRPNIIDVRLGVDRRSYDYGDSVGVTLRTDQDAYVYLFSEEACGTVRQVFPNCFDSDNFLQAHRTYRLPGGGYEFVIRGTGGRETLRAVASSVPLEFLEQEFHRSTHHDPFPTSHYSFSQITTHVNSSLQVHLNDYNSSVSFSHTTSDWGHGAQSISVERRRPLPICPAYGEASISYYVNPVPFCATPVRFVEPPRYYPTKQPVYYHESTSINVQIGGSYTKSRNHFSSGHETYSGHHDRNWNRSHSRGQNSHSYKSNHHSYQPITLKNEKGENPRYHAGNNPPSHYSNNNNNNNNPHQVNRGSYSSGHNGGRY